MRQSLFKSQNPRIFPALYSIPSLMATEEYKPFWTEFIAGWAGGIGLVLAGQPFDLLKVRLQTNGAKYNNSLVKCAQEVISKEGLGSFYKGTASPLVGIGIINSIQFGVYQNCKGYLSSGRMGGNPTFSDMLFSGMAAGFTAGFVVSPVEHIRIRMQSQTASNMLYENTSAAVR